MKKSTQSKTPNDNIDVEEYTQEEIEALDFYQEFSKNIFEDEEIYELMQRFNNDENKIKEELEEMIKIANKGEEYKWHEVGKSKIIFFYLFYRKKTL